MIDSRYLKPRIRYTEYLPDPYLPDEPRVISEYQTAVGLQHTTALRKYRPHRVGKREVVSLVGNGGRFAWIIFPTDPTGRV